ncbi:sterol desaturase family protein [Candidatus Uabimicrobium amorphum]|uniref:Sterol desaturase n=1 Tax=Uabimicrobium amorphum TaxID=2596890 RepID=A0A5S9IS30_UABAM|nr:sterol desaturase family protein [Candidatus Uabimicrobium amorphum]BBM86392.1 sterol desaturase [Candidatus Uabimicrobium amorphum]
MTRRTFIIHIIVFCSVVFTILYTMHNLNASRYVVDREVSNTQLQIPSWQEAREKEQGFFGNYVKWFVPIFVSLILIEVLAAKIMKRRLYRLNDSICDLSCGIAEQLSTITVKAVLFGSYTLVYEICKVKGVLLFHLPNDIFTWLIAFILIDFVYYWVHRFSHTTAIGWAGHCVHHQSEEFNFAVALRHGILQSLFNFWFYLPLAIIGFHPLIYASTKSLNTIYQFWIHTKLVNKIGIMENILNTPSHHRVHHGKNEQYIDKNYAGVFIVWDRLFGSFAPEEEEVVYGTVAPINTWNPFTANFQFLGHLLQLSYQAPFFIDKFKLWLMPPGWTPRETKIATQKHYAFRYKYNPAISAKAAIYASAQFVMTAFCAIFLFGKYKYLGVEKFFMVGFVVFSLICVAAIFDKKSWAFRAECARWCFAIGLYFFWTHTS